MIQKNYIVQVQEYDSEQELSANFQKLIAEAREAGKNAYAPYSKFKVGASILLKNGDIITGNNQENAAYPSGLCAERVAIFYANSKYPNEAVLAMAICATNKNGELKNPVSPCGCCRQVMLETEIRFGTAIRLFLVGKEKIIGIDSFSQLLPLNFNKDSLLE